VSVVPDQQDPTEATAGAAVPEKAGAEAAAAVARAGATAAAGGGDPADDEALLSVQRVERSRRLKLSVFLSVLIKPLAFLTPLITVPLFLRYLGTEGFGLFAAVGALAMWVGMANIGLNVGLVNLLTECSVTDDRVAARRYVSTLTVALAVLLALGTLIYTGIVLAVNWHRVFPVDDPMIGRQTAWAVWIAGAFTLLGMVSGIPQSIYAGYQETHRAVIWDGVAKIVTFLACLTVVWIPRSWGVIAVLIATSAGGAGGGGGGLF
jgi:O-antigen/teichoic acid export membrane protein